MTIHFFGELSLEKCGQYERPIVKVPVTNIRQKLKISKEMDDNR